MKRWALITGGCALPIVESEDKPDEVAQWVEVGPEVQVFDRPLDGGGWAKPGEAPQDVRERAKTELGTSDIRVTRALEDGGPVPAAVKAYRAALREIVRTGVAPAVWPSLSAELAGLRGGA